MKIFVKFFVMDYPATWDNYDEQIENWSIKNGMDSALLNFFLYLAIGFVLDLVLNNFMNCSKKCSKQKVVFENSNMGVIEVSQMRETDQKNNCEYNFTLQKSQICSLIGVDNTQKARLIEMLAGQR